VPLSTGRQATKRIKRIKKENKERVRSLDSRLFSNAFSPKKRYAPNGATLSTRGTVRMPAKSLAAAPKVNAKPLRGGFATLASIDLGTHGLLQFGMQGMWSAPLSGP
jgi:hypothetical protein